MSFPWRLTKFACYFCFYLRRNARENRIRYYTLMVYEDADAVIIHFKFRGRVIRPYFTDSFYIGLINVP